MRPRPGSPLDSELAEAMAELGRLDRKLDAMEVSAGRAWLEGAANAHQLDAEMRRMRVALRAAVKSALIAYGGSMVGLEVRP